MSSSRPVPPAGYVLDAVLGRGAITETFVVVSTVRETVARFVCKRLHARAETDELARATLVREGRALRLLDGTCSPRWVGAGNDEAGPWLLMDHVAAPSLGDRIRARPSGLDTRFVASFTEASFAALARMHSARVVHGDISPDNVLAGTGGHTATFVDFALSRGPEDERVSDGRFRGTLLYAAPEVARGEPFDGAADRFALAASLAHAALGVAPRTGTEATMLLLAGEATLDAYAARARAVLGGAAGDLIARHLAFDARVR